MYSGTPRVLAGLWKVDDDATAELMNEFYRQLLGSELTPAAALRQAQLAQMKKKSAQSPYYWAAFQLQGSGDNETEVTVTTRVPSAPRFRLPPGFQLSFTVMSSNDGADDLDKLHFEHLLNWLNPDRELAGAKYESIRKRLIQLFLCRGSNAAEELADKTINRVARKLPELSQNYVGEPERYFFGVARGLNALQHTSVLNAVVLTKVRGAVLQRNLMKENAGKHQWY
jgi:hypothetical protein